MAHKPRYRTGTRRTRRRGVAATEFAIALPVLLLIVFGAIDLGRVASSQIAVRNGARAGAGYGSMNPASAGTMSVWQARLRACVLAEMQGNIENDPNVAAEDIEVTATRTLESAGSQFRRVDVVVRRPFETFLNWPGLPHQWDLTYKISIRAIR